MMTEPDRTASSPQAPSPNAPSAPVDGLVGRTVLGSFRLVRLLGEGSFATAYLAEQLGTERRAVVKVARPELIRGEHGAVYRQFFDAEARAATKVSHPNLVTIYTTGLVDEELPALAMEYVKGKPLGDVLHEHAPLPDAVTAAVFGQLAGGLEALHAEGVIHRDVSPDNIFVGAGRRGAGVHITLLDFGISHRAGGQALVGGAAGTAPYIAPEQFQGQVTPATDMFSVGVLLWWAVTGKPWLDWMSTDEQIAHLSEMTVAPDPRGVRSELSGPLAVLVRSLLDPDPALRPSAAQLAERLGPALRPEAPPLEPPPLPADALFPDALADAAALGPTTLAPGTHRATDRSKTEPSARPPFEPASGLAGPTTGAAPSPPPPGSARRRRSSQDRVAVPTPPSSSQPEPAWKSLRDSRPVSLRAAAEPPRRSVLRQDSRSLGKPRGAGDGGTSPGVRTSAPRAAASLPMGASRRRTPSQLPMGRRSSQVGLGTTRLRQDSQGADPETGRRVGDARPITSPGLGTRLRQESAPLPVGGPRERTPSQLPLGRRLTPALGGGGALRQESAPLPLGEQRPRTQSQLPLGRRLTPAPGGGGALRQDSQRSDGVQVARDPGLGTRPRSVSGATMAAAGARARRVVCAIRVGAAARESLSLATVRKLVAALEELQMRCELARAAAVIGGDADALVSFSPPGIDLVALHAVAVHASAGGEVLARGLTGSGGSQTVVRAAEGQVVLTPLRLDRRGAALVLLVPGDAPVGLALLAAKRAAEAVDSEFGS